MESESSIRGIVEMAGTAHLSSAFSNLGYLEESGERERKRGGRACERTRSYERCYKDLFGILDPDPAARKRGGTRGGLIDRRKSTGRLSTRPLLLHPPRDIVNFR